MANYNKNYISYIEGKYTKGRIYYMEKNTSQAYQNIQAMLDTITRTSAILHKDNSAQIYNTNIKAANSVIEKALAVLDSNVTTIKNLNEI